MSQCITLRKFFCFTKVTGQLKSRYIHLKMLKYYGYQVLKTQSMLHILLQ